ncbi:hypothetical protein [Amycolatopsis alkalitolerans]|uniref:Uncharacterized protein n=1 Tax=Amycolatopsis alkalitolerans TaxID=2547244 RepID=A0A5C4LV99_9PSEU|nr:hypothetical protein [Amycolatopsis alkalitolerans]TNC23189.1 hypothetical protein FG385_22635 [Amycolatopsis alkalitolerans]
MAGFRLMRIIAVQLAAIWVAGMIVAAGASWLFVVAAFVHAPVLTLPAVLAMFGLVYVIGCLTPDASTLSARAPRRLLWAALITMPGVLGGILMPGVLAGLHFGDLGLGSVVFLSLPFLLIAGALTTNLPVRITAGVLVVALICCGIWLPEGGDTLTAFWQNTFR